MTRIKILSYKSTYFPRKRITRNNLLYFNSWIII